MVRESGSGGAFRIYAASVVVMYAASAGITTVYSMLSLLYREFDDPLRVGWVVTAYWLVASVCAALGGRLGDVFGRRAVAIGVLGIAGVGSLVSANASTLDMIIVGCSLQGATGVLTPLVIGMAREHLPLGKVPLALGIIAAAGTVSAGISFLVAGYFIDRWSWTGGFYMKTVLVAISVVTLLALVPRGSRSQTSFAGVNLMAGVAFAPAIAGVFIALQLASAWGWHDLRVWLLLAASVLALVAWGWHQAKQRNPLIDIRSLGQRQVLVANLSIGLLAMGCFQNGQFMSLLLQQPAATGIGFGFSAMAAGLVLLPLNAIALVGSPLAGHLAGRFGSRWVAISGAVLIVGGWSSIAYLPHSFTWVVASNVVVLFGLALLQTAAYFAIVEATPPERTSEAMGITYVFLNVAIAVGGQSMFMLLASSTEKLATTGDVFPTETAFLRAIGFIVATALVGLGVAWLLPQRSHTLHEIAASRGDASSTVNLPAGGHSSQSFRPER